MNSPDSLAFTRQVLQVRPQKPMECRLVLGIAKDHADLAHRQSGLSSAPDEPGPTEVLRGVLAIAAGAPRCLGKQASTLIQAQRCGADTRAARGLADIDWIVWNHLAARPRDEIPTKKRPYGSPFHWGKVKRLRMARNGTIGGRLAGCWQPQLSGASLPGEHLRDAAGLHPIFACVDLAPVGRPRLRTASAPALGSPPHL